MTIDGSDSSSTRVVSPSVSVRSKYAAGLPAWAAVMRVLSAWMIRLPRSSRTTGADGPSCETRRITVLDRSLAFAFTARYVTFSPSTPDW